ncbi:MAG: sugar phosphate isomerase/epimerase family protein [Acetobacteraceae bacterium]
MVAIEAARIGIDVGRKLRLDDAIAWAALHGVQMIDIQLDTGDTMLTRIDADRAEAVRQAAAQAGVQLGLHTNSAVNIAEYAPLVGEAVDAYLRAYIDVAVALGAAWVVVHAGFHFTSDAPQRMQAALDRLHRSADYAAARQVTLLLENLNKEPPDAEVHYLAHTSEEWRWFYDRLDSPALQLSFTANHAHLVPEGVEGFLQVLPLDRVREVRLADCFRNGVEQHLNPDQGDFDFGALFTALETRGYRGHYTNAFGTLDDMLVARQRFATQGW